MEFSNEAIFLLIQLSLFTCMEKVDKIQYFIRTEQTDKHIPTLMQVFPIFIEVFEG